MNSETFWEAFCKFCSKEYSCIVYFPTLIMYIRVTFQIVRTHNARTSQYYCLPIKCKLLYVCATSTIDVCAIRRQQNVAFLYDDVESSIKSLNKFQPSCRWLSQKKLRFIFDGSLSAEKRWLSIKDQLLWLKTSKGPSMRRTLP